MSILTDILDRLTDISALRVQIGEMRGQQSELRHLIIDQQRDIAELKGQLKALIQMQSAQVRAAPAVVSERKRGG